MNQSQSDQAGAGARPGISNQPRTFKRLAALIVAVCFVVEISVMVLFRSFTSLSPMAIAVIDGFILSVSVLACLYIWVLPALSGSRRHASDQTRLLGALIDAIPVPVFYKDEHGVYTGCNTAFEAYLGRPKAEIIGQSVYGVAPEELAKVYHKADMDLLHQGGRQEYETVVSHADGTEHDVVFHKAVYQKSTGAPGGIVGIILDVTDRNAQQRDLALAKEQAEKASRAKSEFLAAMSHELRTPLNAILGFGQMLHYDTAQPLSAAQAGNVENILAAGYHLLELIDQILDLARIEANRVAVSIEAVEVGPVVAECMAQMAPLADKNGITMAPAVGDGLKAVLRTDQLRFKQVLINILSNAVKYNVPGGTVELSAEMTQSGYLHVAVADTGIGIDPKAAAGLFQMFYRAEARGKLAREGVGIGLAVCRLLVERLAGRIGFESRPGGGSTFWFELPLAENATALIWTDEMRLDVDAIDKDHQDMAQAVNALAHAVGDGEQVDGALSSLRRLAAHCRRREAAVMRAVGYPGADARAARTEALVGAIERLADGTGMFADTPLDLAVVAGVASQVADWLNDPELLDSDGLAHHARGRAAEIRDALEELRN